MTEHPTSHEGRRPTTARPAAPAEGRGAQLRSQDSPEHAQPPAPPEPGGHRPRPRAAGEELAGTVADRAARL
ncbi:serine/threonine protein phosphatase, partial [Streptomyces triticagri]